MEAEAGFSQAAGLVIKVGLNPRGVSGMGCGSSGAGGGGVYAEDAHEPENMGRCIESHKINKR